MREDLRRETYRTAVGGDRAADRPVAGCWVAESPRESLSVLAKLGARLIIQRAVEDEFDAWLGRARYERRPDADLAAAWAAPTTFPRRSGSWSPALTPSQSAASSSARRPPREGCDCPSAPTTSASAA